MDTIKLTEKSTEVFNYVKDNGGRVSLGELAVGLNRTERSVNANVVDLTKKGLCVRSKEKATEEGAKDITYVSLTDEGKNFVPAAE